MTKSRYVFLTPVCYLLLFCLAIYFNQLSGNRGLFPLDSLGFFDTGYKFLQGSYPIKDFWITTGIFIEINQALIFKIFGINWQTYVLNASLLNALFVMCAFYFFQSFKLKIRLNFFFCLSLAVLSYPSSGTPFVDHHSTFLSLVSIMFLIIGLKDQNYKLIFLAPLFLGFAFFSKQVPAGYFILIFFIVIVYSLKYLNNFNKKYFLLSLFLSIITFLILLFAFLKFTNIQFKQLIYQYILYPLDLGENRISNKKFDIKNIFFDFKFIYLAYLPGCFFMVKNLFNKNQILNKINFILFLSFTLSFIFLIIHQNLTKNQNFIFFLIPYFSAFSCILMNKTFKYEKILIVFLILLTAFSTLKYYERFNLNKKFHELYNVDFSNSIDAATISPQLKTLRWITPGSLSIKDTKDEIEKIKRINEYLLQEKKEFMLITNYSLFSVIQQKNIYTPGRWYTTDGTTFPLKSSKFYDLYKIFFLELIEKNNIELIYLTNDISTMLVEDYVDISCYEKKELAIQNLISYKIEKNCK